MKVNEETIHTHASLDSKDYGYCARRDESTITRSFTILSPKISTLDDLRTTKLATNKATNVLEGFTRVIFNFILYESLWTRNMKYQYEIR